MQNGQCDFFGLVLWHSAWGGVPLFTGRQPTQNGQRDFFPFFCVGVRVPLGVIVWTVFIFQVVHIPGCSVLISEGGKSGFGLNRTLFIKRIPPTSWGRKPSSEWERVGASKAGRPRYVVIVVVVVVVVVDDVVAAVAV